MSSRKNLNGLIVRPVERDDMKLILKTWKNTWRVCPWAGVIRNDQYYKTLEDTMEGLVARGATFQVACLEARPASILGWICSEVVLSGETCVHYLYIKDPYLGNFDEISERLLAETAGRKPGFFTFRYRQVADACLPRKFKHAPEIARRK